MGKALDAYMRFRAKQEGVGYGLSPEFFADAICDGVTTFFGVTVREAKMVGDDQRPELLKQWQSLC